MRDIGNKKKLMKLECEFEIIKMYEDKNRRLAMKALGDIPWLERRISELEKGCPGYKPAECGEDSDEYDQIKTAVERILGVPIEMSSSMNEEGHGTVSIKF